MSYKCRICGSNDVENNGDICELCAIGQDPYATGMSSSTNSHKHHVLNSNDEDDNNGYSPKRTSNRKVLLNGGSDFTRWNGKSKVYCYAWRIRIY